MPAHSASPAVENAPAAKLHILLVEDVPDDAELIREELLEAGLSPVVHRVETAAQLTEALAQGQYDLVFSDYNLPGFGAAEALKLVRAHSPDLPFILVSGRIGEEEAVALMKAGADDYVMKDRLTLLVPALQRSLKDAHNRLQSRAATLALRESEARFKSIVSNVPGMVFKLVLSDGGRYSFIYVSDGCQALLGVPAQRLVDDPEAFLTLVVPEDLPSFTDSMQVSALDCTSWNWEGRILPTYSAQVKWVNLRASPRAQEHGRLWDGVISNITQSKLSALELQRAHEQLIELSEHAERAKEEERARIAREIHDELGGTLTAIKIALLQLEKRLPAGSDLALKHARSTMVMVDAAIDATRRISTELRPGILDLGIVAAIEWQAAEFEKRMEIPCRVACAEREIPLAGETSIALFRIFQEALTNVAKHAGGASQVEVELESNDSDVRLLVHDDGRGTARAVPGKQRGFGILGMQERAHKLGGEASVRTGSGGTTVTVRLPRRARAAKNKK
jgi:signal transduction histidine kinase